MKAEQRKELETNTLADKMGQAMLKAKEASRRGVMMYGAIGVACLVAVFLIYRYIDSNKVGSSEEWYKFHDGQRGYIEEISKNESNAGKAARLQIAWFYYWELGVKRIGHTLPGGYEGIEAAAEQYEAVRKLSEDDPIFEPQAMLGLAVCKESLTIKEAANLDKAKGLYEELHKKYEKSAEGRFAKERFDAIDKKGSTVADTYVRLQEVIRPQGGFGGGIPELPKGFDPNNPAHQRILQQLHQGIGK